MLSGSKIRRHSTRGCARGCARGFCPFLTELEPDLWSVHYDAQSFCTLFLEPFDADSVHQITVQGPCKDPRFWDALAVVLGLGNVILYSPGASRPLLRDEAVEAHIPRGLLQTLGIPLGVRTGQEIRTELASA